MISLDLYGPFLKDKEKLIWQLKSQWIGKGPLTMPIELKIGLGIPIPKYFGSIKKKQALNQLLIPDKIIDFGKALDFYENLMQNILVVNKNQFYKTSIEKFYCEKPRTIIYFTPKISESFISSASRIL